MDSDRIENISMHPSLSIAMDYKRITVNDVWYRYEEATDSLVRCTTDDLPQAELFASDSHE